MRSTLRIVVQAVLAALVVVLAYASGDWLSDPNVSEGLLLALAFVATAVAASRLLRPGGPAGPPALPGEREQRAPAEPQPPKSRRPKRRGSSRTSPLGGPAITLFGDAPEELPFGMDPVAEDAEEAVGTPRVRRVPRQARGEQPEPAVEIPAAAAAGDPELAEAMEREEALRRELEAAARARERAQRAAAERAERERREREEAERRQREEAERRERERLEAERAEQERRERERLEAERAEQERRERERLEAERAEQERREREQAERQEREQAERRERERRERRAREEEERARLSDIEAAERSAREEAERLAALGSPAAAPPAPVSVPPRGSGELLDLNAATPEQLSLMPGIGPAAARRIVAEREANGPYRSLEDLERAGINLSRINRLRGHLSA